MYFRKNSPAGDIRLCGIILPGKSAPEIGSFNWTGLDPASSALKSPRRMASLGTMSLNTVPCRRRVLSRSEKKNNLFLRIGPPKV